MDGHAPALVAETSGSSRRARQSRLGLVLPDDRFIPVHSDDLVQAVVEQADAFPRVTRDIEALAAEMDHVIDQETTAFQRAISRRYECCNPARETKVVDDDNDEQAIAELQRMVGYLLEKANYEHLDDAAIESTINLASSHGMTIRTHPDRLARLDLYVRGQDEDEQIRRSLRAPIRGESHTIEVFRRLVVVFQFKDEPWLNLKLFRDIPVADVEALLPHAEVAMSVVDRLKIAVGGAGAFGGIAWKVVTGTAVLGQLAWAGIVALFGLSFRAFFGYRRARVHRAAQMTHNLYYRIVASNAGVLELLLGSIGQEELKEAVLGYSLLLHRPELSTEEDLRRAASEWIEETFAVSVDFDAPDAIETLDRFELWEDRGQLIPVPPPEALRRLREHWQDRKSQSYHLAGRGRAPARP